VASWPTYTGVIVDILALVVEKEEDMIVDMLALVVEEEDMIVDILEVVVEDILEVIVNTEEEADCSTLAVVVNLVDILVEGLGVAQHWLSKALNTSDSVVVEECYLFERLVEVLLEDIFDLELAFELGLEVYLGCILSCRSRLATKDHAYRI